MTVRCAVHHVDANLCGCDTMEQYRKAQAMTDKPQAEALKPCPSCRASMEPYETHRLSEIYHRHPQNGCVLSDFRVSPDDQKAWNTRATLEPSEAMMQTLRWYAKRTASLGKTGLERSNAHSDLLEDGGAKARAAVRAIIKTLETK